MPNPIADVDLDAALTHIFTSRPLQGGTPVEKTAWCGVLIAEQIVGTLTTTTLANPVPGALTTPGQQGVTLQKLNQQGTTIAPQLKHRWTSVNAGHLDGCRKVRDFVRVVVDQLQPAT